MKISLKPKIKSYQTTINDSNLSNIYNDLNSILIMLLLVVGRI